MEMKFDKAINKNKIAIVVVGYNRLRSITRLLDSILCAHYPTDGIPLVISIDCSGNKELYSYVQNFKWPFGEKYLRIQNKRLGLKDHILSCGDLTGSFKAIILLEDDLYVSADFYNYTSAVLEKYSGDEDVAGISLYSHEFNGFVGLPFTPLNNGADVYAVQSVSSWGQCWTAEMWSGFKNWLNEGEIEFFDYDMPHEIKMWDKAWSKYFYAYLLATNKYFIFPYIPLSTNCGEAGEHGNETSTDWQVSLLYGFKDYNLRDFMGLIKYDVYSNFVGIFDILHMDKNELCLDLYGHNNNSKKKRYLLTVRKLPYKIIRKYALKFRPIEMNIIEAVEGDDIFLYDTNAIADAPKGNSYNFMKYYFRSFKRRVIFKFLFLDIYISVKNKFL